MSSAPCPQIVSVYVLPFGWQTKSHTHTKQQIKLSSCRMMTGSNLSQHHLLHQNHHGAVQFDSSLGVIYCKRSSKSLGLFRQETDCPSHGLYYHIYARRRIRTSDTRSFTIFSSFWFLFRPSQGARSEFTIAVFQGEVYLSCDTVQWCGRIPTFRRTMLAPSSGCDVV
jgi:hypothetical protein